MTTLVRLLCQVGYQQREQEYRSNDSEPEQKGIRAIGLTLVRLLCQVGYANEKARCVPVTV